MSLKSPEKPYPRRLQPDAVISRHTSPNRSCRTQHREYLEICILHGTQQLGIYKPSKLLKYVKFRDSYLAEYFWGINEILALTPVLLLFRLGNKDMNILNAAAAIQGTVFPELWGLWYMPVRTSSWPHCELEA